MDPIARFLAACRREPVDRPPVWIMRQAGRYMASYRALRARASFLDICRRPELSCEATMMAVDQLGVDAAILFSDILVPLEAMGLEVHFPEGGPEIAPPVRTAEDVARLRVDGAADALGYVYEAVALIDRTLAQRPERLPLLGFAGAPWTLATYAVEGSTGKNKHALRRMVYDAPDALHALLDKLTRVVADYLVRQVQAGAHAVQVFDTWGGLLSEAEWRAWSMPYTTRVLEAVRATGVPTIHYALDASHLVGALAELPCDVLSVDHREPLASIRERTGGRFALQGNVEPGVMTASPRAIRDAVRACLADYGPRPGHIVNLGHGITPDATVEAARLFVDTAKELGARAGGAA
ncbi:MAG: uroporphyrinogen decarboxylase [Deltaproteobacteria bacterium]|nr:uroporphyrinogen decarboxylase [Deltaproteobacteria bacterium]